MGCSIGGPTMRVPTRVVALFVPEMDDSGAMENIIFLLQRAWRSEGETDRISNF